MQNRLGKTTAIYTPTNGITTGYSKGDILIGNIRPYLKKIWYSTNNGGSSPDVLTFEVNKNLNSKFIYYTLFKDDFFVHMMNGSKGTKMPRGDKNQILDFPIPDFDYLIQGKIASFLSALDSKIELNNKINSELEAMAKTLYDYWFIQFDFPDAHGKPYKSSGGKMVWNAELKRDIPEGWEVKMIKDISKIIMGQSPKGESYNQLGLGSPLLNGPADYENESLLARTYTTEPTRLCKIGDLVFCVRATIGKLTYAEKEFCLGRGVAAVRPNNEKISELLFYSLLQEIERFKIHATGSIIIGITKEDLTDSYFIEPPCNLIDLFHNMSKPIFDNQRKNKLENQELSNLRDWLLPMLMNGQVTVR